MYKALLDKVSRGRNLPPKRAAFFIAGEKPGEMEAICSSFLPLLILCRLSLLRWALVWACGALSISWKVMVPTIQVPMLMCDKVTLEFDRQQPIIPILYFDAENSIIHSINYVIIGAANLANKYV